MKKKTEKKASGEVSAESNNTDFTAMEAKLRAAGRAWSESLRSVGEVLLEMETKGYPMRIAFSILQNDLKMPVSSAKCCLRWAKGEFGDDERALMLMGKVSHSILCQWSHETIVSACADEHRIISPNEQRVVSKTLAAMTPREVRSNIDAKGFLPISRSVDRVPEFRSCVATAIEFSDGGEPILVSRGREVIRMSVPSKLLRKLKPQNDAAQAAD